MGKYDKENYLTWDTNPLTWRDHVSVKTMENLSDYISGKVLDIGCNAGTKSYWLKDFNINQFVGVDVNPESLVIARNNFHDFPFKSEFKHMNIVEEKIDDVFDTIVCFHVFEHIYPDDVPSFLSNVSDMLNDKGFLIMGMPYDKAFNDKCHVAWYKVDSLVEVMSKNGFDTIRAYKEDRYRDRNNLIGLFKKK